MGLTSHSTGHNAADSGLNIERETENDRVVALAGNPNVGKSTVFNELTGLNQHTGNWPGKTVSNAQGKYVYQDTNYILVDIPGTYSLMAHSVEEQVARDFICFGDADAVVVVCDATCLERNLNLVLQTLEITDHVIVCVNLLDEAEKKHIHIDFALLEENLGVPVIGTSARSRKGLDQLMKGIAQVTTDQKESHPLHVRYTRPVEEAIAIVEPAVAKHLDRKLNARWISLKLIDGEETLLEGLHTYLGRQIEEEPEVKEKLAQAKACLLEQEISESKLKDLMVSCIVLEAEGACCDVLSYDKTDYNARDRKLDKWLTSKWTGIPIMLLLLAVIFWLTITGSNYPSSLLSQGLFWIEDRLTDFFAWLSTPEWVHGALVLGIYRVLAWVVSVMLPPMAIFFPLFTLLEDLGYLPRVAFNLDKHFKKCCACGKQALTMCMGFGCNAAGVVGCRIIDSPRERLMAIVTNNFVPCNGRFPMMISIITMFFVGSIAGPFQSVFATLLLTSVILLGIVMTFTISRVLSKTLLKGVPSSFTLELPPYRRPQIGKVIVRSIFDRTLFVLGRAVAVAAPAGLIIWLMANIIIGDMSVLAHCCAFLDPFAKWFGMDGVILIAFILGFPANEIVVPIIIMAYMASGSLLEFDSLTQLKELLVNNGWTWVTAVSVLLFSLMHWPCSTTCMTIHKETQSKKWTLISFAIPTVTGLIICFLFTNIVRLIGMI